MIYRIFITARNFENYSEVSFPANFNSDTMEVIYDRENYMSISNRIMAERRDAILNEIGKTTYWRYPITFVSV